MNKRNGVALGKIYSPACRSAPHLPIARIPDGNPVASIDAIITLTPADIAARPSSIRTCRAGFLSMAAGAYKPLPEVLALPPDRKYACAMMSGYPQYKTCGIPRRKHVEIVWG